LKKLHAFSLFFKEGIKGFKIHGSLLPSSKYLGESILRQVKMIDGVFIVELGAGTGAFTRMIISRMPENARLIVFEINPIMVGHLRQHIIDQRVTIIDDDAVKMREYLKRFGRRQPDYIISGIPIGNYSKSARDTLLTTIHDSMGEHSLFLQFQYLLASLVPIKKVFDARIVSYEYRNIPPAFIYGCRKKVKK